MARIVKEEEYNAKRNEILDFSLSLVYSKGYDQMTIQEILDGLQISRGALYHYFDSKQALLDALVDRMGKEAVQTLLPIVQDPELSALQKFQHYFEASASWKTVQKEFIANLLPMWYSDENAFIRQKMTTMTMQQTPRLLEPMIRQGIEERVFTTRFPAQVAVIITGITLGVADSIIGRLLSPHPDPSTVEEWENTLDAYVESVERILGAPAGSLKVFDADGFKTWYAALHIEPESK